MSSNKLVNEFMSAIETYFKGNISSPDFIDTSGYSSFVRYYIFEDYMMTITLPNLHTGPDINCCVSIKKRDSECLVSVDIPQKLFINDSLKCCLYISDLMGNLYTELDRFIEIENNTYRRLLALGLTNFRSIPLVTYSRLNNRGILCSRLEVYQVVDDSARCMLELYVLFDGYSTKYRVHFSVSIRGDNGRLRKLIETNKVYTKDSIRYGLTCIQDKLKSRKIYDKKLFNVLETLKRYGNTIFTY